MWNVNITATLWESKVGINAIIANFVCLWLLTHYPCCRYAYVTWVLCAIGINKKYNTWFWTPSSCETKVVFHHFAAGVFMNRNKESWYNIALRGQRSLADSQYYSLLLCAYLLHWRFRLWWMTSFNLFALRYNVTVCSLQSAPSFALVNHYRPQTKFGKVIVSQAYVRGGWGGFRRGGGRGLGGSR